MRTGLPDVKGAGRVVRGSVSSSGGIVSGSGFIAARTAQGNYDITFVPAFKAPPNFEATFGTSSAWFAHWSSKTPSVVHVVISDVATNSQDGAFDFRAEEADPA